MATHSRYGSDYGSDSQLVNVEEGMGRVPYSQAGAVTSKGSALIGSEVQVFASIEILNSKAAKASVPTAYLRGNTATVKKLEEAGYAQLESWEDIVKQIEGLVYVGDGFRWYWTRYAAPPFMS